MRAFQKLIDHETDIRPYFEKALFQHYQEHIYHSMTMWSPELGEHGADELTPPLEKPEEIWKLIDTPSVWIRPDVYNVGGHQFRLAFDCHWDPEHGLGVQFRNWKIREFGGTAD